MQISSIRAIATNRKPGKASVRNVARHNNTIGMATYMASASDRHIVSNEWDVSVQDLNDDQFHRMKQYLTAEGRGRKVGLTKQSVATNKLLLQLDCLRQTCEKSWDEISAFVDKVCDENIFAHTTLKTEVNHAIRGVSTLSCDGDLQRFLETDVRFELESRNIGHFLQKKGIKRHHLLSPDTFDHFGKKSSLLKVTGSVLKLVNQLLEFFGGEVLERLPAIQPEVQPNKHPCLERSNSSEDDSDQSEDHPSSDEDNNEEEQTADNFEHFNYQFRQPEELIAVYFEDDFFIGAVHNILSEDQAEVNFMTKATVGRGANARHVYRWPHSLDVYPINSSVVFASNLTLAPSSSSGRSSVVDWPNDLRQRYDAFKRFLFENRL